MDIIGLKEVLKDPSFSAGIERFAEGVAKMERAAKLKARKTASKKAKPIKKKKITPKAKRTQS